MYKGNHFIFFFIYSSVIDKEYFNLIIKRIKEIKLENCYLSFYNYFLIIIRLNYHPKKNK